MSQQTKKEVHPAHQVFKDVPDDKKLVRVYNKAEGALKHEITLADGTTVPYEIKGGSFAKVPKEVADLWLRDFPDRIVSDNEAQALVSGARAEADRLREEKEKLTKELAALKAKADPKGELAKAQKEIEELRKQVDVLTAPPVTGEGANDQV